MRGVVQGVSCRVSLHGEESAAALHFAEKALRERHVQLNVGQRPVVAPVHQPVDQFGRPVGLTPVTAAAVTLLRRLGETPDPALGDWRMLAHHGTAASINGALLLQILLSPRSPAAQ